MINLQGFRDAPIQKKLSIAIVGTSFVAIFLASIAIASFQWLSLRAAQQSDLETLGDVVSNHVTAALSFDDQRTASETLAALAARPHARRACVYRETETGPRLFASWRSGTSVTACPFRPPRTSSRTAFHFEIFNPIQLGTERLGELWLRESNEGAWKQIERNLLVLLAILILCLVVASLMARWMQQFIATPIVSLWETTRRITESRNYSYRAKPTSNDEVGQLFNGFNKMLVRIEQSERAQRTMLSEKTAANEKLSRTVEELQQTQDQLVQTEKMASLGALVAGIAHEINTPIGVGVTAASTLDGRTRQIHDDFKASRMTRSALQNYLQTTTESTAMILANLNRAADLIQSFKQVATDQSSGSRRRFHLGAYLDEVLMSLQPHLKKTSHIIKVRCPPEIELDSFPGAYSQIVTNLVMNSLVHAFDGMDGGLIEIDAGVKNASLQFRYADNGCGADAQALRKLFEPFYTTRRGRGGSGLGLHIVFNLVTQQLRGTIHAAPVDNGGLAFEITLPLEL